MLTKLEEQILMTVWKFKGEGYGVNIFRKLEEINAQRVTLGVVYDILERLAKKGLLNAYKGDSTPVRGGMRKKYYDITRQGIEELTRSKRVNDSIWHGFSELLASTKKNRTK